MSNEQLLARNVDRLTISDLHLDNGIIAPYVFGDRKQQPASVTISLDLDQGFSSAASSDALDQNTVHYGNLAKAVRYKRPEGQTLQDLIYWVEEAVDRMAERRNGSSRVRRSMVCVRLPKASMAGECVEVTIERLGRAERTVKVALRGVRIMVLIGVNSNERTAKQPLEVDLEVLYRGDDALERDVQAFGLEREMAEIIEPTKYETLESLGEHVVKHLQPKIVDALPSCFRMSLTMRKPKAIAFAQAPALTLMRYLTQEGGGMGAMGAQYGVRESDDRKLTLIKPYSSDDPLSLLLQKQERQELHA